VFRADPTGNVVADRLHPLAEATPPRPTRWVPRQLTSGVTRRD